MLPPGPRPKADKLKVIEGNRGHQRKRPALEFRCQTPVAPASLPKSAKPYWDDLIPRLVDEIPLLGIDNSALADLCVCVARLDRAERDIERRGLLVRGAKGNRVKNPALQVAREYRMSVQRWFATFGLTPADRQRLGPQKPKKAVDKLKESLA